MQGPALIANLNFEPEPRVIGMMRFDPDGKVWRGALPLARGGGRCLPRVALRRSSAMRRSPFGCTLRSAPARCAGAAQPPAQRDAGNEEVLREFEPKKGPALIQNINRSFVQTGAAPRLVSAAPRLPGLLGVTCPSRTPRAVQAVPALRGGVDAHAPMRAVICKRATGGDRAVVGGMVFDGDRMRWVGNEAELEGFDADSCCGSDFECDGDSRARLKWLGWLAGWLCLPPLLSSALLRNQNAALH